MGEVVLFDDLGVTIASRFQLLGAGMTSRDLTAAVRHQQLLRVRRDHYALPGTDPHILKAVRIGGRISCDTALRSHGVFGFDTARTHVHVPRDASRLRAPDGERRPRAHPLERAELHWYSFVEASDGSECRVSLIDALACTLRCADWRHALASIDNALHLGLLRQWEVGEVFARVPDRFQPLKRRVNPLCEAGQETVLRLAFEDAGLKPELQVQIPGVGRTDFVLGGRLICEADSRLAHDGWEMHVRDRDRDLAAARQGYMTLRPTYNRIMYTTDDVVAAVMGLLSSPRGSSKWR